MLISNQQVNSVIKAYEVTRNQTGLFKRRSPFDGVIPCYCHRKQESFI